MVDGYGGDKTFELINEYRDSRIRYIFNKDDRGASHARNTGLFFPLSIFWTISRSVNIWLWIFTAVLIALMSYLCISAAKKGLG